MERSSLGRGEVLNGPGTVLHLFGGYAKASDGGVEDEVLDKTTGPEEGKKKKKKRKAKYNSGEGKRGCTEEIAKVKLTFARRLVVCPGA